MEAMLCGCVVIGYDGRGGREYFHPKFSYSVEAGDIIGFVQKIEAVLAAYRENPTLIIGKGRNASEHISLHYNSQNEEADLIKTWSEILNRNLK
jgi:glycosyltransferase involved in cell wall biosynthesis